jgi:hypothetical protein
LKNFARLYKFNLKIFIIEVIQLQLAAGLMMLWIARAMQHYRVARMVVVVSHAPKSEKLDGTLGTLVFLVCLAGLLVSFLVLAVHWHMLRRGTNADTEAQVYL